MIGGNDDAAELLRFLCAAAAEPMPEDLAGESNETVIAERLRQVAESDDAWVARASEHERWIGRAMQHFGHRVPEHARRTVEPLGWQFGELSELAASMGLYSGLAWLALGHRENIEPDVRALLEDMLRDVAAAGARAWARLDQAAWLLSAIEAS